jgi:hypothetical protein
MVRDLQLLVVGAATVRPGPVFAVEGTTLDEVRLAARDLVAARGYRMRSLSFTPTGLLAYVAEPGA